MPIPDPKLGLVLRYSFLWPTPPTDGRQHEKDRPVVVVASRATEDCPRRVTVMPITHTQPDDPAAGVEIPQPLKKQLGLDMERSWIRVDAANSFEWPGHDLRQIPDSPGEFAYGHLPPNFYGRVVEGFNEYKKDKRRKTVTVDRDDIQVTI